MDERSLELIEYPLVIAAIADRAASARGRASLAEWRPIADAAERAAESAGLAEAIRRTAEPGDWCAVGPDDLAAVLDRLALDVPEGERLLTVLGWLEAARVTRTMWEDGAVTERYPWLAARVAAIEPLEPLRRRLAESLDGEGKIRDRASPLLRRLRAELGAGERKLAERLERWARGFGPQAYVTRHTERWVAMVPAAGFPRRRAIVHDVSGSGGSLLVEPLESCGENNRLIEMRRAAAEEERRVLAELTRDTLAARPGLEAVERALVHLDTLHARAVWANEYRAVALLPAGQALVLEGARHPLLAMSVGRDAAEVVPLDLELHTPRVPGQLLLVSGPNMGGKTVLLKTVGLAVAFAHAALPVTAGEGSRIPEVDELLADIGDEQSLAQGLSTFAAHLLALARMAAAAGPRTLVLSDELGAGTDPEDGAALAHALLEHLAGHRAWGVVTTHLGSLKRLAGELPGVENGSLEFDLATLAPCYRFLPGVPGASHALEVAERLGFPPALLERARTLRPEGLQALERLMGELAEATRRARAEIASAQAARRAAEEEATCHRQAAEAARAEEAALRRRLTRESEAVLARARAMWQTVEREARRQEQRRVSAAVVRQEMVEAERAVQSLAAGAEEASGQGVPLAVHDLVPGARVRVLDLGVVAEVVSAPDREGRVQLKRGPWSIQSHVRKLAAAEPAAAGAVARPVAATWATPEEGAPLEVDLRGMDVADALAAVDQGVDRAVLAGLGELRVIHGIGKGVLRSAVERHLKHHPQVAGQRAGQVGEGGRGVTVARLR